MAHIVKCLYCEKKFDRDKMPYIQVGRRYAHKECSLTAEERKTQEEQDKQDLDNYIIQLLKIDYIDARIRKQIKTYIEENNYTYSGIKKALIYFYEVKGNSIEKANGGIGIVPFIYKDAFNYYYALWQAQQQNKDKVIVDYQPKVIEVVIPRPQRKVKQRQLFTFLDEESD
jgi:hypothetical protein